MATFGHIQHRFTLSWYAPCYRTYVRASIQGKEGGINEHGNDFARHRGSHDLRHGDPLRDSSVGGCAPYGAQVHPPRGFARFAVFAASYYS